MDMDDDWHLEKAYSFKKVYSIPYDFKGELVTACGTDWDITFKYIPFFEISVRCGQVDHDVLVRAIVCHGVNNTTKQRDHKFISGEKSYDFKFNLQYRCHSSYITDPRQYEDIFVVVNFFQKRSNSDIIPDEINDITSENNAVEVCSEGVLSRLETKNESETNQKQFSDNIVSNFQQLLNEKKFCDAEVKCGGDVFHVHRAILSARSPVFDAMFQSNMKEDKTGKVNIEDVKLEAFQAILLYIYSGTWSKESYSVETTCEILAAANMYMLSGLKESCVDVLRSSISMKNALNILPLADLYDAQLKRDAVEFVCINYDGLSRTPQWKNLQIQNPQLIFEVMNEKIELLKLNH